MLGHIPLPQVTDQLTERIEKLPDEGDSEDEQDESEDEEESPEAAAKRIPELQDIFRVGQYVQTIVIDRTCRWYHRSKYRPRQTQERNRSREQTGCLEHCTEGSE
jgi:hypothetical protein